MRRIDGRMQTALPRHLRMMRPATHSLFSAAGTRAVGFRDEAQGLQNEKAPGRGAFVQICEAERGVVITLRLKIMWLGYKIEIAFRRKR